MHVWDSRRKRMVEEGESIISQSWNSSAGGLGYGQPHRIWQLIVSQELPERHCHSEGTQPYYYQNTKWQWKVNRIVTCHTCLCLSKTAEKGEMGGEALVITPRPDVTSSQKEKKKKTQQARKNFTSQLKPNLEAKVCVKTANGGQLISFQKLALTTSDLSALFYRPSCRRTRGYLLREVKWSVRTSYISKFFK